MASIILILFCFAAGFLFRRNRIMPENAPSVLNGFIIYLSLPAITLYHIHRISFSSEMIYPVVMPWLVFILAFIFFAILHKAGYISREVAGALTLTCGLGNTSFIGFPMTEYFYGRDALPVAVLADQPGTFTVLSSLGIATAAFYSSGKVDLAEVTRKIFYFPPFIAFIAAVLLNGVSFPGWLDELLVKTGDTLTPLALVSVGLQIEPEKMTGQLKEILTGLSFKLILAPVIVFFLFREFIGSDLQIFKVTVFEAAMAPMITGGIIATRYGLAPNLVSSVLGLGIPVSFLTLFVWFRTVLSQ